MIREFDQTLLYFMTKIDGELPKGIPQMPLVGTNGYILGNEQDWRLK